MMYRLLVTGAVCFGLGIGFSNMPFLYSYGPHTHEAVACADLDNYVEQTKGITDFQYHFSIFGIHRQRTIDAVNELYERAHCDPKPTDMPGRMVYQKVPADVVPDQMPDAEGNLAPRSVPATAVLEPPRSYPLYSHGVLVSPPTADAPSASTTSTPKAYVTSRRHAAINGSLPRRTYTVMDEEAQAGTPAGAQDTDGSTLPCHKRPLPGQPDWQESGPICP